VFTSDKTGNNDIWVINANGIGAVNLTKAAGRDTTPDWQPLAQ
jgi:Tol biopolymer transport system component